MDMHLLVLHWEKSHSDALINITAFPGFWGFRVR